MSSDRQPIRTVVWGTGNVGRAAIRAVDAHPDSSSPPSSWPTPPRWDATPGRWRTSGATLGVAATDDVDSVLADRPGAVVYAVSGDVRPDAAAADVARALRAGAVVVTPSIYALYDHRSAPAALRDPLVAAASEGGGCAVRVGHRSRAGATTCCRS